MVDPLRRVIVKTPEAAFRSQSIIESQWKDYYFLNPPNLQLAVRQHTAFVNHLRIEGAEVLYMDPDERTGLDSIYTHDPGIVTDAGAILFQTGKVLRRGEAAAMEDMMKKWEVPVLGRIEEEATAEGGDMIWLDHDTLLIGRGFRTNDAGISRLRTLLSPLGVDVIAFHLPHWAGPEDVLHLMSFLSLVDQDLAVVHLPLMPVPLYELLQARKIQMVEVPPEEYNLLGCNVLAIAPRRVMMMEGNPETRSRLRNAGCEVIEFEGSEIAFKGSGGPTCLTRPLLRE